MPKDARLDECMNPDLVSRYVEPDSVTSSAQSLSGTHPTFDTAKAMQFRIMHEIHKTLLEKTKLRLIYRWQPIKSRSQGRTATW
jgi:hypothetical protein